VGVRALRAAGPRIWNNLLTDLRQPTLPFQTVAKDVFIWAVRPKRDMNPLFTAYFKHLLRTWK